MEVSLNKANGDEVTFAVNLCFALCGIALFAISMVQTEVYLTGDHLLADADLANNCFICADQ